MKFDDFLNKYNIKQSQIKSLTLNSVEVKKGSIFFAVKGERTDGNIYIKQAIAKGALAVISEQKASIKTKIPIVIVKNIDETILSFANSFYGDISKHLDIIGITGTKGKTSITYLVESIFSVAKKNTAVIGSINYRINGKVKAKAKNTTPLILSLREFLKSAVKAKSNFLAMEVSSHSLEEKRVDGMNFNTAVFTNLQRDHLDFHKNFNNYFKAKLKLFKNLTNTENYKENKTAIINIDDKYGKKLYQLLKGKINLITFGLISKADYSPINIKTTIDGLEFKTKNKKFKLNLLGEHNVYNALCAMAICRHYKISWANIYTGLSKLNGVPGRLEKIKESKKIHIFVDFSYTKESLQKAIDTLSKFKTKKLITVFGCGGNRDRTKRPLMGKTACASSDNVIITNDNPRKENTKQIFDDIKQGIKKFNNYTIVEDRKKAIYAAIDLAQKDDIILIAGKGHEDYQILSDKVIKFSDKEHAINCVKLADKKQLNK